MDKTGSDSTISIGNPKVDPALLLAADEIGIRLEVVGGFPMWEAAPAARHQKALYRVQASIRPIPEHPAGCGCFHLADVYIRFPDGSIKRPDISVFCQEPPDTDDAIEMLPEAVIEITNRGYEVKDLEISPYFYMAQGIKDVIVFDPRTLVVLHIRKESTRRLVSPVEIVLECGCQCTV